MNKYVSDTMALVLHLEKRKMPAKAKEIFTSIAHVSTIWK